MGTANTGADRVAHQLVDHAIRMSRIDRQSAGYAADWLTQPARAVPFALISAALVAQLAAALRRAIAHGWGPRDLGEVTRRRAGEKAIPLLAALLRKELSAHGGSAAPDQWRQEVEALGRPEQLVRRAALDQALFLAASLRDLPPLPRLQPAPGESGARLSAASPRAATAGPHAKLLAKVRALLAKAESTDFPDEAEALSAKAQALISQHSLDDLLAGADRSDNGGATVVARRLWIDGSYVMPKAMLIGAVARANRSKTVVAESLGCVTVIGAPADLDAVELLSTSLLAQAGTAMTRAGRESVAGAAARTASFRRAFLMAYAARVGERLEEADRVVTESGGAALVPVLSQHSERVSAVMDDLFPHTVKRTTTVSNGFGWAQGRAAADQATLHSRREVS